VERLDHLDDEADDRGGGEELAAELTLGHREGGEEVLVDLAEDVTAKVGRDGTNALEQLDERGVVEAGVGFREDASEVLVLGLDRVHRVYDGLGDVLALGQVEEMGVAGRLGQVEDPTGLEVILADRAAAAGLGGELSLGLGEPDVGVAEEDQAEDRGGVLGRPEVGVGAELVGGVPESALDVGERVGLGRRPPRPVAASADRLGGGSFGVGVGEAGDRLVRVDVRDLDHPSPTVMPSTRLPPTRRLVMETLTGGDIKSSRDAQLEHRRSGLELTPQEDREVVGEVGGVDLQRGALAAGWVELDRDDVRAIA
jgi:hypothetical protein